MALDPHGSNSKNEAALDGMRAAELMERELSEIRGQLGAHWKALKADGHDIKAMKRAMKLSRLGQPEAVIEQRNVIHYYSLRRQPMTQIDLFGDLDLTVIGRPERTDLWDAEDEGYRAGRHGVAIEECPHQPGSEAFDEWRRAWAKGERSIARELGSDARVASARSDRPPRQSRIPGTEARMRAPGAMASDNSSDNGDRASVRKSDRKKARKKAARRSARRTAPVAAENGVPVY